MDSRRITDDEAAVLRSWLAGNEVHAIAKARRATFDQVTGTLRELCGFDRTRGRQVLDTGRLQAPPTTNPPAGADREVRQRLEGEVARLRRSYDDALTDMEQLRAQLDELGADARKATEERDAALAELHTRPRLPVPLVEYGAWHCRDCGRTTLPIEHDGRLHCRGRLEPVTVAILPLRAA